MDLITVFLVRVGNFYAKAANIILSNFDSSESLLEVRTIGAFAPRITDATLAFAKKISDL